LGLRCAATSKIDDAIDLACTHRRTYEVDRFNVFEAPVAFYKFHVLLSFGERLSLTRRIQHLRTIIAPVADRRVGGRHLHPAGVVGMQQIERRPRIATLENAEPTVIVPGVKDEGETVMDNSRSPVSRLRPMTGWGSPGAAL
jgi:hypothetical protein